MATIQLKQVEKVYGELHAVKPMDLTIHDGEFVVLLGPSGCGKTTTLRMISGLESVTTGAITFDERNVTWLSPSDRDIAFVFQFFALYSHMTARENIAFPLQAAGMNRDQIRERITDVAQMLRIGHLLDSRPGGLSGGDQQRVALARALVRRPAAFLMDEPLGALDAEFRESMRAEIKKLHITQGATTVYVTHDQVEAMAMSDRIVVMSAAEIQQVGSPAEVYYNPSNLFVARFIGSPGMNLIEGQYSSGTVQFDVGKSYTVPDEWRGALENGLGDDGKVVVGFRPEAVIVSSEQGIDSAVYANDLYGGHTVMHLEIAPGHIIHSRAGREISYEIGAPMKFDINPEMVRFFDPRSELVLTREGA